MDIASAHTTWSKALKELLEEIRSSAAEEDEPKLIALSDAAAAITTAALRTQLSVQALSCVAEINHVAAVAFGRKQRIDDELNCRIREQTALAQLLHHIAHPKASQMASWTPGKLRIRMSKSCIATAQVFRRVDMADAEAEALDIAMAVLEGSAEQHSSIEDRPDMALLLACAMEMRAESAACTTDPDVAVHFKQAAQAHCQLANAFYNSANLDILQ